MNPYLVQLQEMIARDQNGRYQAAGLSNMDAVRQILVEADFINLEKLYDDVRIRREVHELDGRRII